MKLIIWQDADQKTRDNALARPLHKDDHSLAESVAHILSEVKCRGDVALRHFSREFDQVNLMDMRVSLHDIERAYKALDGELRQAMLQAQSNITRFHEHEYPKGFDVETMPGVRCRLLWRALDRVGFYIPGGSAPLFSSVFMQAIPAKIAGCSQMILCTPPQRNGSIHPTILAAAYMCGIKEVFALGGAHAIAALAYGSASLPKVDKIFGPGNSYVTMAKQQVSQDPKGAAIDMPAGPSEVMVIADSPSRPDWIAADLLAQAEHDPTAQAVLVTTDKSLAEQVQQCVTQQLPLLSRKSIAEQSIKESRIILVTDMPTAIEVANLYAPEHLIIHNQDAEQWVPQIRHAGSIFVGALTPESAGDYASGTNHVLPTYGYARAYNGLTVLSFMKSMTVQNLSREGLDNLSNTIITLAEAEGLSAHARAVSIRKESQA